MLLEFARADVSRQPHISSCKKERCAISFRYSLATALTESSQRKLVGNGRLTTTTTAVAERRRFLSLSSCEGRLDGLNCPWLPTTRNNSIILTPLK